MSPDTKHLQLENIIRGYESAVVAFSGGVDSTLVLAVARQVLGSRVLAVTALSPSLPARERRAAVALCRQIGARHRLIETREMALPEYASNPANRCYHCKNELYGMIEPIARQEGLRCILNGANRDDLGDYRPGLKSASEFGVKSPLCAAGFTKTEVRALSHKLGLPTWEKPAMPCLASRVPYGQEVTAGKLRMVEQAEDFLWELGFRECRVRHYGALARIELPKGKIGTFMAGPLWPRTRDRLRAIGFQTVEVDLTGFQSGKLNAAITSVPLDPTGQGAF